MSKGARISGNTFWLVNTIRCYHAQILLHPRDLVPYHMEDKDNPIEPLLASSLP